jgi:hypothetical protein
MSEFWDNNIITTEEVCPASVLQNIKSNIKNLHNVVPPNYPPVNGDYWECILTNSFREANFNCVWYGEKKKKHKPGTDITVSGLTHENISCKSGEIKYTNKKEVLNISSYRTTKYKTIDEKLNYIDRGHEDIVYSLSSTFYRSHNKYILTIFTPPKFKQMVWKKVITKKNKVNYISSKVNGVCARINDSQSDQLWYTLDYNCPLILERHEILL